MLIQLDKNSGSKKLRDECNSSCGMSCQLLPRGIRDAEDPDVIRYSHSEKRLLVTFDRALIEDYSPILCEGHSGVLLLRMDDNSVSRISRKTAQKILSNFKSDFEQWRFIDWTGWIIELTPSLVFVYVAEDNRLKRASYWDRGTEGWAVMMANFLCPPK